MKIRKSKVIISTIILLFGIYCIVEVFQFSDHIHPIIALGAELFMLTWFAWTAFTISNHHREKNQRDLLFRFSRTISGFPDEFDRFCEKYNIQDKDKFAERAIIEKMYRYEKERQE